MANFYFKYKSAVSQHALFPPKIMSVVDSWLGIKNDLMLQIFFLFKKH